MRFLAKLILAVVVNAVALLAADAWVTGLTLTGGYGGLLTVAAILTLLNFLVKPLLKLVLGPIIVLTLGLGLIFVHVLVLAILDFLSPDLSIGNVSAYFVTALIIGLVNFSFHLLTRSES